jgi:site-specific recombinase XerD
MSHCGLGTTAPARKLPTCIGFDASSSFTDVAHPRDLGPEHVTTFLNDLATKRQVSASTQNQALAALLFLYDVLQCDLGRFKNVVRAKRPERLPTVLSTADVIALLDRMQGVTLLASSVLYGAGLRLSECVSLRVKDLDLSTREIRVRDGKGRKDRVAPFPVSLVPRMLAHIQNVRAQHQIDLQQRAGFANYPTDSLASTRTPRETGPGNGCSRQLGSTSTHQQAKYADTTSTKQSSKEPSAAPRSSPASANP